MAQVSNIFNFLKDFNELSNPVITEIGKQRWYLRVSNIPQIEEVWSVFDTKDFEELKILEVKRPDVEPCPAPHNLILDWIVGDWKKPSVESITYKEEIQREIKNEDGTTTQQVEYFTDNKDRVNNFENWIKKRERWRTVEFPKQMGLDLYHRLYNLYSIIKKEPESVELILGDGHIRWMTHERTIDHPVLLQKVHLKFDPEKPSFLIICDEVKTDIYMPMLRVIPNANQRMLSEIINEVENSSFHIADTENIIGFFQRLINAVDKNGRYVKSFEDKYSGPMISHAPVLFLRKRNLGYSVFLDNVIKDIEDNDIIFPDFLENMVGNYKEYEEVDSTQDMWNENGVDQDVLLTLPANNEQLRTIRHLNKYGAVLVQGPPGTGKTHTIANIIGHLLSEGKNILVTSHTEKALTVVKEKVYKDLQNLCISLLSSSSQRKEMDVALFEIAEKSTNTDLSDLMDKIVRLEQERKVFVDKYKMKNQELTQIRSIDYKDIVFANEVMSPIEAAKFVGKGAGKYDYIPGKSLDDTASMPLSLEELKNLYRTNKLLTADEEGILDRDLPCFDDVWPINHLTEKLETYYKLQASIKDWEPKLMITDDIKEEVLQNLLCEAIEIRKSLKNLEGFHWKIISKNVKDKIYIGFWKELFEDFEELMIEYEKYRKVLFENDFFIPEEFIHEESLVTLDEIIDTQKEIPINFFNGFLRPRWKNIQNSITNAGTHIEKREDYCNARVIISYEFKRNKVIKKIDKLMEEVNEKVDFATSNIETKIEEYINKVQLALDWYDKSWTSYSSKLQQYVLEVDTYSKLCGLDESWSAESLMKLIDVIISDLDKKYQSILLKKTINDLELYKGFLKKYQSCGPIIGIIDSLEKENLEGYEIYYAKLANLYPKTDTYLRRKELLRKLGRLAPDWANAISNREGIHGKGVLPEDIDLAWKWNQLNSQINRINSYDPNSIQKELSALNKSLRENACELAYSKAWYYKIKNNTPQQTQAIEGWRQTMKQVGKGTGKTAPILLKKARELMPLCQMAIPVWIMPLNRVAENFDPKRNKFDVVIIDEASQANILALSALYLGEKIIIVGDDEQVSPDSVGINTDEITALIEQHLQGVPNNHLFNGKTSVYDMAKASGFKPIMLTEHFRCLPEIIEFSNQLSYNGKIKPLRDASNVQIKPSVVEYRVPNGYRTSDKVNEAEA